jgi:hypothetical protein
MPLFIELLFEFDAVLVVVVVDVVVGAAFLVVSDVVFLSDVSDCFIASVLLNSCLLLPLMLFNLGL